MQATSTVRKMSATRSDGKRSDKAKRQSIERRKLRKIKQGAQT